jgi:hypothetical protein
LFGVVSTGACLRQKVIEKPLPILIRCKVKPLAPLEVAIERQDCAWAVCYDNPNAIRLLQYLAMMQRKLSEYAEQCAEEVEGARSGPIL